MQYSANHYTFLGSIFLLCTQRNSINASYHPELGEGLESTTGKGSEFPGR